MTFYIPKLFLVLIPSLVLMLFAAGALAASQGGTKTAAEAKSAELSKDPDYVIGIEDILEIAVWKNPDLSKIVAVRPDGMISLPLIGDMRAAGLTPLQLRDNINESLKEYQETVVTSVIVQEVRSYRIFVLGEVLNPGTYNLSRKTTVLQAIAMAGGMSQFASNSIILVREGRGGEVEKTRIRFSEIVDEDAKKDKNLVLRPGDTIFVR
ncbi:MAG: polysaccharide biosynthesis/export family protein [Deltaproteobacteria bacterium]|nr:polysaccharide biosynthesis/export family protein [Deltaproteobacteria bacterium]MBZ0219139.1 polysaccharide export protein [Deltaproteobacteria bacterium]